MAAGVWLLRRPKFREDQRAIEDDRDADAECSIVDSILQGARSKFFAGEFVELGC